jgi:hypothetical protein
MEMRYERLDPKNDFLFRNLFSSAGNEDLLIDLLNTIPQTSGGTADLPGNGRQPNQRKGFC